MIRVEFGIYSRDEISAFCTVFLAPLPEVAPEAPAVLPDFPGCQHIADFFVDFGKGKPLPVGTERFIDPNCSLDYGLPSFRPYVSTTEGPAAATALCQAVDSKYQRSRPACLALCGLAHQVGNMPTYSSARS